MNISITFYPNCTWILDGDAFYCTHDDVVVMVYLEEQERLGVFHQIEREGYVCAECGESVEGDPVADRQDAIAEMQLMEALGK